jgi:hypothetical protein
MSREGILNTELSSGSSIKATMWLGRMRAKEHSIWLACLLDIPNFVVRCSYKQNTQGRVKVTYILKKRSDWQQRVEDTKAIVASFITRSENLNGG